MPGTFLGMGNLKGLDFSVNVVRKVRMMILCRALKPGNSFVVANFDTKLYIPCTVNI